MECNDRNSMLGGQSLFGKKEASLRKYREFVADSVIQATGTVEFEDGLRTGVLLGGCWGP